MYMIQLVIGSQGHKPVGELHGQRTADILVGPKEAHGVTTPAAFKTIDASHSLALLVRVWNTPEVVSVRTHGPGPADRLPLQEIIRHQVAPGVAGCSVEIDRLASQQTDEDSSQQFAVRVGQKESRLLP